MVQESVHPGDCGTATITHGSADVVRGSILSLNPAFLLDALGTFTGDTITLHIRGMKEGQAAKPVLLTEGADMAGDGYRRLLIPYGCPAVPSGGMPAPTAGFDRSAVRSLVSPGGSGCGGAETGGYGAV
ncbi:hypothetical protein OG741_01075 [Streptomyces sp. NBC_01410]|uniref:hypothetical protein n=1 Tax=Streptomyces sp. NBC_01410 TaxID=2903856 RepID=UPI0032430C7F